ncbi:Tripartite tricarboxylate transporter family receptor [Tritonibacter multivorans]|uniref:Tripartite tricarboxylate transporter family receptor n=1 Tax=Tritonibacter multivorans TaxID=928856 RepID=A0A0N7LYZ3_9RHOB|nr:tripartite tricarboxylate transporter substrate-binding protein [Tritonibacter multivorans]MDA7419811.1 tripartite tricarboxylate transporter substrate-binding protein [Tritonibacter multivorans]CUH76225.1 Tripartite tricarboxylate transporter family receptor [Tritonibacter multivorans]SFC52948.1 Tripartite-type tricarboxylate transporter, receptor component TctC [Tritonibacter multivorans]
MRKLLKSAVVAAAVIGTSTATLAEDWAPPGPIKMVIAFAAGGGADTQARLIAEELEATQGWKVIPEQVTGKGGLNAVNAVKDAPADGTTIAMIVTSSLGYSMVTAKAGSPQDVTPITTTAGTQMAVVARADKGWSTLGDVIEAAKGGEDIRFGVMSPALGDIAYLVGKENGVDFNIISVKGGKAVMNGLNAGDMDVGFGAGIQAKAVAAGDMVELASARSEPLINSPEAPLLSEYGVNFVSELAFLFAGPKDMDPVARAAIASAIAEVATQEGGKANAFLTKGFGGAMIIAGEELEAVVQKGFESSGALAAAAAE